jgi:histidinol phosphatase-like PHP family hydrolase
MLSDGVLNPVELIRRAVVNGYTALGIADHCGRGPMARILAEVGADCALARAHWGFPAFAGVELTHVPASSIAVLAAEAKAAGAAFVVVHGESPVEPVEPGTNLAACSCPDVDILAHPGILDDESAAAAAHNGVFLEVTARSGHNTGNGRVVAAARGAGARMILGSDTHAPRDLLTPAFALTVLAGAGLSDDEVAQILEVNGREMLERCKSRVQS